jgi:hypothetical protein
MSCEVEHLSSRLYASFSAFEAILQSSGRDLATLPLLPASLHGVEPPIRPG